MLCKLALSVLKYLLVIEHVLLKGQNKYSGVVAVKKIQVTLCVLKQQMRPGREWDL